MKILLACSMGMSTTLLVKKMKEAAKEKNLDDQIWAVNQLEIEEEMKKADILLIGPQIRMLKKKLERKAEENGILIDVIPPSVYGKIDGKSVLELAHKLGR